MGQLDEAERHLIRFLHPFTESDYARPMVREQAHVRPALERLLDDSPSPSRADSAKRLLIMVDFERWQQAGGTVISPRGIAVQQRLEAHSDRETERRWVLRRPGALPHQQHLQATESGQAPGRRAPRAGDRPSRVSDRSREPRVRGTRLLSSDVVYTLRFPCQLIASGRPEICE